jgi:hypothetical protein
MMDEKIQVFAVIRLDDRSNIEDGITVKEILPTLEEAIREVERLNSLNAMKGSRYFWQTTRFFPQGRTRSE